MLFIRDTCYRFDLQNIRNPRFFMNIKSTCSPMALYHISRLLELYAKMRARFEHAISRVNLYQCQYVQMSSLSSNVKSRQSNVNLSADSDLVPNTHAIKNIFDMCRRPYLLHSIHFLSTSDLCHCICIILQA